MQKPKKKIIIKRRQFTFFGGIAFCLFAVILILNVAPVARGIAFPFAFAFGLCSYVIYIAIYIYGLYLFFTEKLLKIKFNNYLIGAFILFISALMISTLIVVSVGDPIKIGLKANEETGVQAFSTYYSKTVVDGVESGHGYWKASFVNLFKINKFGGGFVGYFLVAAFNTLFKNSQTVTWVVAIFIFLLGAFVIFFPAMKKIIFGKNAGKVKAPKNKPQKASEDYRSVQNVDVIAGASKLDDFDYQPNNEPSREPQISYGNQNAPAPRPQEQVQVSINTYGVAASFAPAFYSKYASKPQVNESISEKYVSPQPENKTIVNEQLKLNFGGGPTPEERDLMSRPPEFIEPKNAPRNVSQNIIPQPPVAQPPQPTIPPAEDVPVVEKPKPIKWVRPSPDLLETVEVQDAIDANNTLAINRMEEINRVLEGFHIGAKCVSYVVGPAVTRYNIAYDADVSIRSVSKLGDDIALRLGGVMARFEAVVEGQPYSGLEVPNAKVTTVSFKEVYESLPDVKKHPMAIVFGKSIEGKYRYADFDEFPHCLVSGTTGSGKSIFTHSVIVTLIMRNSPEDLKLVLVDPKKVELTKYRDLPHLLCPIINEAEVAKLTLDKLVEEMNRRYEVLMDNGVSNLKQYNELREENPSLEKMPYILVFIDEYADLVDTCKEISQPVVSIAQKARAAGIHMLIATQRPSTNIITGVIKGNLPTRVALKVASAIDSVTIVGEGGGEKLLGRGDMLAQSPLLSTSGMVRLQGCYIQNKEINRVVGYLKDHYPCYYDPNYTDLLTKSKQAAADVIGSPEFAEAQENSEEGKYQSVKEWVMANEYMSMSRIQRECGVGFNRAGRFFKRLQEEGIVATEVEGNKGCPVLVHDKFFEGSADTDIPVSLDQTDPL